MSALVETLHQMEQDESANFHHAATRANHYAQAEPHTCDGFLFAAYSGIAARHKQRRNALAEAQRALAQMETLKRFFDVVRELHYGRMPTHVQEAHDQVLAALTPAKE